MKKSITSILFVLALAFSVNAQAQYKNGVEQYPTTDWRHSYIEYDLGEIATAMGYGSATEFATVFTTSLRANQEGATFDGAISFTCSAVVYAGTTMTSQPRLTSSRRIFLL